LDSGTTALAVARALKRFSRLTVITNGVNIAQELAATAIEIILVGGSLRKNSSSLVGPLAEDSLRGIHADILFLGVDGFDLEHGATTPNLLESRVARAMVRSAHKVVMVCDSSKFRRTSMARIAPASAIHHVITDRGLSRETIEAMRSRGLEVTLV
jgi:DeoR family transcriptional regulator of aga operon